MYVRAKWILTMVLAAAVLGIAGCKGEVGSAGGKGDTGAQGQSGDEGAPGAQGGAGPAGQTGPQGPAGPTAPFATVSGYVKFTLGVDPTTYPASGVTVTAYLSGTNTIVATASTGSDGSYSFSSTKNPLPYGSYDFKYAGSDYATDTTSRTKIYVPATGLTLQTLMLTRTNPLYVQLGTPDIIPFGTSGQVKSLKVIAGTPTTYAWTVVSGPTTGVTAFTAGANAAIPTLAMDSLANIRSALGLTLPTRPGLFAVSQDLQSKMSYKIQCVVGDGTHTTTVSTSVAPAFPTNGNRSNVPLGVMQILMDDPSKGASWTLVGPGKATLSNIADVNAWFIPDAAGTWVAQNLAPGGATIAIQVDTFIGIDNCKTCHNGTNNLADKYSDLMAGKHMNHDGALGVLDQSHTLFASGINGLQQGAHYSAGCLPCHTTGYQPDSRAVNGGFDDFATTLGWTFPDNSTVDTTRFSSLPPALQALAGMQCETCHGPASVHGGPTEGAVPSPSYSADICAYCHDKPKSHDKVYLWKLSKHAVRTTIATETSCSKCHSANNFIKWAKGGFKLDFTAPPPSANEIEPTTCQTCHDPHRTALRASGDVALLNGYTVSGAGSGILCMVCHNSQSGLHDDYSATPGGKGPHEGTQADVMFGVNAYFVNGYQVSQHATVDDDCVGCHMKLHPAFMEDGVTPLAVSKTNHTFRADGSICVTCHVGPGVTAEGTAGAFDFAVADLEAKMMSAMKPRLPATYYVVAQDPGGVTDPVRRLSPKAVTLTQSPTAIDVALYADCATLVMTLATPVPDPFNSGNTTTTLWVKATDIDRAGPILVTADGINDPQYTIAQPVIGKDGTFAKALWNILLLTRDRSHGIHNPSYAFDVLGATKARVLGESADPL